ncbi:G-box-binding factor 1-like isoform X1 [Senna tora]|uniref:G-box-binding factor 1-like isoform X1 n=1 Tax=Senna tora TaxID=362788 RepID=A0A834X9E6_9FABA|nr:G-box-binding factor 1-like isoform X1 [Senna tora]
MKRNIGLRIVVRSMDLNNLVMVNPNEGKLGQQKSLVGSKLQMNLTGNSKQTFATTSFYCNIGLSNFGSTETPFMNSCTPGFSIPPYIWANQEYSTSLQYHPIVSEDFALTTSEREKSIFIEKKMDSTKSCNGNLKPESIISKKSRENGNGHSLTKKARDGPFLRASESLEEDHDSDDTNNDFLTKKQQCDMVVANGNTAEKVDDTAINSKLQELKELEKSVDNIMRENSSLKKKLMSLSKDCVELAHLNDSIEKELIEMYGSELIADLVAAKPP